MNYLLVRTADGATKIGARILEVANGSLTGGNEIATLATSGGGAFEDFDEAAAPATPAAAKVRLYAKADGLLYSKDDAGTETLVSGGSGGGGAVDSVFGRTGAVVAATNDYTFAQINKTTSSLADLTTRSAGDLSSGTLPDARFPATLPAASGVNLTSLNASNLASGTVPAARMPALTGDVTSSVGTVSTTIANNTVTLAKLADIATASFLGRNTAATGDPEVLSIATAKTMLNLTGTNSGDVTLAGQNYLTIAGQVITANAVNLSGTHATGILAAGRFPALTGDVTTSAGSLATTIAAQTSAFWLGKVSDETGSGLWVFNNSPSLITPQLGVATATSLHINAATANLYLKDTSTGFQAASTLVVTPQANNAIRSTSYTSGLVGWNINATGNAEFNNVDVRGAIRSSIFVYNALQATAGTLGVFKSAAKLRSDVAVPASPTYGTTTVNIDAVDQDGLTHAASQLFVANDILRLKDGLVGDTWFKVSSVSDQTTFWRYVCIIMAGSNNVTFRAGIGIADYGLSGAGFIIQTADLTNSPYLQMATHAASFTSQDASGTLSVTPRLRVGNLNGSYGYATNVYGLGAGQYGVASNTWFTIDETNGFRLGNNTTVRAQWFADGNIVLGEQVAGKSHAIISSTAIELKSGSAIRINLNGDGSGYLANSAISWDASGNLTVSANATIAGWTVVSTHLAKDTGTNSTSSGMAPADYPFFAGAIYANRATAPFRVTPAGSLTASSGTIAGWTIATNKLTKSEVTIAAGVNPTDVDATAEAWFGKGALGHNGVFLKGTTGARLGMESNNPNIGTAGRPYLYIYDGTRRRVVLGELNFAWGADGATNSIGMKIWDSAGAKLAEFSDVQNIIAGWAIASTKISSTGIDIHSGANAALAFGATPPTSASAGTGIWEDRTGWYGLLAGVVQAKLDATTGAITAGAGSLIMDASGLSLNQGSASVNSIAWRGASSQFAFIYAVDGASAAELHQIVRGHDASDTQVSMNFLAANSANNVRSQLGLFANQSNSTSYALFYDGGASVGQFIGVNIHPGAGQTPTALLHVSGDTIRLDTAKTPASATAAGNQGDICWDSSFLYVCVAASTWKRVGISTW